MGAGPKPNDAFEERRQELKELQETATLSKGASIEGLPAVTDQDVFNSFRDSVRPDGFMTNFLRHGQMGLVLHDTLFIHGGVNDKTLGYLPFSKDPSKREGNVRKWVDAMNGFVKQEVTTASLHA